MELERPIMHMANHLHLVPKFRMRGSLRLLPHTPSQSDAEVQGRNFILFTFSEITKANDY
jgi:hypothetical protein